MNTPPLLAPGHELTTDPVTRIARERGMGYRKEMGGPLEKSADRVANHGAIAGTVRDREPRELGGPRSAASAYSAVQTLSLN